MLLRFAVLFCLFSLNLFLGAIIFSKNVVISSLESQLQHAINDGRRLREDHLAAKNTLTDAERRVRIAEQQLADTQSKTDAQQSVAGMLRVELGRALDAKAAAESDLANVRRKLADEARARLALDASLKAMNSETAAAQSTIARLKRELAAMMATSDGVDGAAPTADARGDRPENRTGSASDQSVERAVNARAAETPKDQPTAITPSGIETSAITPGAPPDSANPAPETQSGTLPNTATGATPANEPAPPPSTTARVTIKPDTRAPTAVDGSALSTPVTANPQVAPTEVKDKPSAPPAAAAPAKKAPAAAAPAKPRQAAKKRPKPSTSGSSSDVFGFGF